MRFINGDGEYGDQHYYVFSNVESQGIDIGMAGEGVLAWGEGPWTGRFESFVFAFGPVTGSIFWTEEDGGWKGFTYGVAWPLPAIARETTDYQEAPDTIGGGQ